MSTKIVHLVDPTWVDRRVESAQARARCKILRKIGDLALTLESAKGHEGRVCKRCRQDWVRS